MKIKLSVLIMVFLLSLTCPDRSYAFPSPTRAFPSPEHLKYPPLQFQLPKVDRKILPNGISLYLAEDHELPLVKITALIKVGNADDPLGKEGLAELTGQVLLTGGTQLLTGDEIDEALAFMAADIRCNVTLEYTLLTLSVLKKDLDRALEIFARILKNPVFEQGKFQVAKALKVEELRRISDNPDDLAFRQYRELLYQGDPRGRLSTFTSLDSIDRPDLATFHEAHFSPENVMLAVSGDVTGDEALAKLNRCLGDWRHGTGGRNPLPPPVGGQKSSLSLIPKDTPQSIIIYGLLGPGINSPDFYPFTILDFILGSGGFQSRIFQEIRTNRGLAYSSGSFYQGRKDYGVFEAYAFTKAGSTTQTLHVINDIIQQVQIQKISQREMQRAKNAIKNNFIFTFKTADDVAFQQLMTEYRELPRNFLETYDEKIDAVKADDLKRVALKYFPKQKVVILVVGPEKDFDAPLSKFGTVIRINPFPDQK